MEERGFEVLRTLGGGAQGRVYEVRTREGKCCVLKQLPWIRADDRERAMKEVHLLSSLRHPFIVPYLDSFPARSIPSIASEDVLCLVMSRCEHDLRQECIQKRSSSEKFEEAQIVAWCAQLCWGLQYLHARKFLHRDLKSQNVLLNSRRCALLADFGVSGQLEHTQDFRQTVVGTPAFMSPEMLEGRPYGCKTDQWALGCVLFEVMALETPFATCASYAAVVMAVLQAPPIRAPEGYSPELSAMTEALLSRKPDGRPSNADLLGGPLLRDQFRELVRNSANEIYESAGRAVTPVPRTSRCPSRIPLPSPEPSEVEGGGDAEEYYDSDFESYSGSDTEEAAAPVAAQGSVCLGGWRQLQVEARVLLQLERSASDPGEEARKVRAVLCRSLGSPEQVDRALEFLRSRRPLDEADSVDELVLQIEVVDAFGDAGLQALPLLERCLALDASTTAEGG